MAGHMDMQFFSESGSWHKPQGAVSVEVVIKGGDAGWRIAEGDRIIPGTQGEVVYKEIPAARPPPLQPPYASMSSSLAVPCLLAPMALSMRNACLPPSQR
jgi:hypothetical protein